MDTDFEIDYKSYNELLFVDGQPINDINFVQNQRAEVASMLGSHVVNNDNFLPPLDNVSEDEAFNDWTPKGVQSTDELLTYIESQSKKD